MGMCPCAPTYEAYDSRPTLSKEIYLPPLPMSMCMAWQGHSTKNESEIYENFKLLRLCSFRPLSAPKSADRPLGEFICQLCAAKLPKGCDSRLSVRSVGDFRTMEVKPVPLNVRTFMRDVPKGYKSFILTHDGAFGM